MESRTTQLIRQAGPWALLGLAVVAALIFRCVDLPIKPLHSDEGVNGWFSLRLLWTGEYRYVPSDYHGPLLYYVNLVWFWILVTTDFSLRFGTALAGSLAVASLVLYRRTIGPVGMAVAALLLAIMPMDVYYSRTVIHEVYLVLFTLILVGVVPWWLTRGGYGLAVVAGLALAGMFATKETAIISVVCIGLSAMTVWILWPRLQPGAFAAPVPIRGRRDVLDALEARWRQLLVAALAGGVALVVLFSSFFSHLEGIAGIFTSYSSWAEYGVTGRNQGKALTYWLTFVPQVWPALLLGLPELVMGAWRRERPTIFLAVWFVTSLLVYSAIPYKTPWCGLNISLPLVLLAGLGAARVGLWCVSPFRIAAISVLGLLLLLIFGRASWVQNQQRYDDNDLPFVYVQTQREYMGMVERMMEVDALGNHGGQLRVSSSPGKGTTFSIFLPVRSRPGGKGPRAEGG